MTATILYFIPMDKLPNRLRAMRKKAGMTLVQLGEQIGLTHTHLSNMERGHRKLDLETMEKLARILDCSVADFLTEDHFPYRLSAEEAKLIAEVRRMDAGDRHRLADIASAFAPEPAELADLPRAANGNHA